MDSAPPKSASWSRSSAGEVPPDELAEQLRQYTAGNPFFLTALLSHLDDVAHVRTDDGAWVTATELGAAGLPASVRGVIARRLSHLDSSAREALDVAAVTGLTFDERIIRGVLGSSVDETVDALDAATAGGLVREDGAGRYAFTHALVRHAVLDGLSKTRRAHLHWRIATEIEHDDPSRPGEVAFHYASGRDVGDAAIIVRTSLAAGDDAMQRLAFDEAAEHFRTALAAADRMPPDADTRYRVLTSLGNALNAVAEPDHAEPHWLEAADLAQQMRDPERLFAALLGYGYVTRMGYDAEIPDRLDALLDLLGPEDSPVRASALGWRAMPVSRVGVTRPVENDLQMADAAVAMARRLGHTGALASTLRSRLQLEAQAPDAPAMLRDAEELAALREVPHGTMRSEHANEWIALTRALLRVGRRADAEKSLTVARAEAEAAGLRMDIHDVLNVDSAIATASGRFREGKRLAAEAARIAGRHTTQVELVFAAQILASRMEQGRLDEVIAGLRQLDGFAIPLPAWRAMLAGALADAGHHAAARAELSRFDEHPGYPKDYGTSLSIRHLAEACRQLGDHERAAALLPHVQPWAGQLLIVAAGLSIDGASDRAIGHLLATIGRFDEAEAAYTAAAELERTAGFPPLVARTEYWHARALLERDAPGDRDRAASLLDGVVDGVRPTGHDAPLTAGSAVALNVAERDVPVDRRLLREAEHALADDVALDLVGAPGDRLGRHRQQHLGDRAVDEAVVTRERAGGAGEQRVGGRPPVAPPHWPRACPVTLRPRAAGRRCGWPGPVGPSTRGPAARRRGRRTVGGPAGRRRGR